MRIFVMWSGAPGHTAAEALYDLLSATAPGVRIFLSSRSLEPGDPWSQQLADNLREANVGIACLTREGAHSRWIHYEAGMVAKLPRHRLIPIRYGLQAIEGPLGHLQSVDGTKESGVWSMVETLNSDRPRRKRLSRSMLQTAFQDAWPLYADEIDTLK